MTKLLFMDNKNFKRQEIVMPIPDYARLLVKNK
jgi:hypothetical protein